MPSWIATLLSVLTGGVITIISAWIADLRLANREREGRKEERRERLAIRRNEFQRETLLALQVASQKLLRVTGAMLHQDVISFRKTGQWQKQLFGEDLSNEHLHKLTETMLLSSRIIDRHTRELAESLREHVVSVCSSTNENEAESRMGAAQAIQEALIQQIGMLVREIDTSD